MLIVSVERDTVASQRTAYVVKEGSVTNQRMKRHRESDVSSQPSGKGAAIRESAAYKGQEESFKRLAEMLLT